jgi:putative tryptophan/tyrosine transport system substrate-binding protein
MEGAMRRREFIRFLGCGILICPSVALAQQSGKQTKIGWLAPNSRDASIQFLQVFRQGLEHLGHVEGQDIAIEVRYADLNFDRLPGLAAELVEQKADIIVTLATQAAVAARKATSTIPIVAISVTDPVGRGPCREPRETRRERDRPGFRCGSRHFQQGLELLKEAVPGLQMVALLLNPANPFHADAGSKIEAAALVLNVRASSFQVRRTDEIATAFEAIAQAHYGAVFIVADTLFYGERAHIAKLAMAYQLPSMHQLRDEAEAGGLMSYGPDFYDLVRRGATYVHVIKKGAKPADLPVQQPTKFELVINLNTARALGLTIPPTLLLRADGMIE